MEKDKRKGRVTIPTDVDVVNDGAQMRSVIVTEQTIRKNFGM